MGLTLMIFLPQSQSVNFKDFNKTSSCLVKPIYQYHYHHSFGTKLFCIDYNWPEFYIFCLLYPFSNRWWFGPNWYRGLYRRENLQLCRRDENFQSFYWNELHASCDWMQFFRMLVCSRKLWKFNMLQLNLHSNLFCRKLFKHFCWRLLLVFEWMWFMWIILNLLRVWDKLLSLEWHLFGILSEWILSWYSEQIMLE